ncbi:MAG UNVERIFIED_CONTAM: hypothetical protein LVR18_16215 [Planctomycetaceae bacterium]
MNAAPLLQDQPQGTAIPIAEIPAILQDLSSPEFARRQAAAGRLQTSVADTASLTLIDRELRNSAEPERVRRLLEILEAQYERCDFRSPEAVALSELLEQAAFSESWFVSEAARSILKRLWKRRVEIAVTELLRLRVPLEPSDPSELWKADDNPRNLRSIHPSAGSCGFTPMNTGPQIPASLYFSGDFQSSHRGHALVVVL